MQILPLCKGALLCFWLSLALAVSFCYADDKTVEVDGIGECADCAQNNFNTKQAFSGLHVTIDCKAVDGHFKTRGTGQLDEEGKFKVSLPKDILKKEGELKEDCYAQLHSSSSTPCPSHDGLESSKIVSQSKTDEKHTFGLSGKLKFSPFTCASEFFWHHFHNHPFFHAPPKAPEPKEEPPVPAPKKEPPVPAPKKEAPVPKMEKPCPPKKEEKPKPKPLPPPVPEKKPCPPKKEEKPKPKPKPKPLPPPVPKKEPCPPKKEKPDLPPPAPVYKTPEHPFHKHPFFKHLPPFPKIPPHHPLFSKLPPSPEIHHKYFDHPNIGYSPSAPSYDPHHP